MFKETASFKSTWNKKILKRLKNIRYELRRMNEIGIAAEKSFLPDKRPDSVRVNHTQG